ncbi:hypothetical protein ROS62_18510 [Streptomyces sp. DSM 41972]|uniref:DUF2812 domain-containing protein n=1 Tax=Streptomyces althioticus subsp. attaecolombicae TaxID=3075534 RepID=A0ABU3I1E4_9ACTN|nr:hypothetical protein [Streptomyces sp. DSM 41972]SCD31121.1 hypothetical protein GA0115238_10189 [Streptomyces sp. di50b]SCE29187.1 hypothetical protein GA0115245_129210 [Streptomyces sp. di188]
MTDTATYFEALSALLRERGMPHTRVDALVQELGTYAAEAGSSVADEFGPVEELAAQLTEREGMGSTGGTEGPGAEADHWVWTADALKEVRLLEQFGAQGWEVERLDRLGRFVCRRDRRRPMRWAYRRESVSHRNREERTEELAPEGWELFGVWGPLAYYKRPDAVLVGPESQLAHPPAPPRRHVYIAPWIYVWVAVSLLAVVAVAWRGALGIDVSDNGTLVGALVGLVAGGFLGLWLWRTARRDQPGRDNGETPD